jgi:hypothetical protein
MRQLTILSSIVFIFLFASCEGKAQNDENSITKSTNKIEVIDFYGTHRCVTCKAIEANTKYTIDTYFSNEQEKGTIVFKTVNVDNDKNYDIAEDFEATGTALFLNVVKNGKQRHIDLTELAFSKGNDQKDFSLELKNIIETELRGL